MTIVGQRYVGSIHHALAKQAHYSHTSEIISEADAYRYATRQGAHVDIRSYHLLRACADRCRELAAAMELPVAGIDLRRTPEGQWYCFEVNPSPTFTYYQGATGQPIDEAIAKLLTAQSMTDLKR